MLLRFFKINDPYRLLGVAVLMLLFSQPVFLNPAANTIQELRNFVLGEGISEGKLMYSGIVDSTAPLSAVVFGVMDLVFGRSLTGQHILALLVLIFQASYFAILLINNKAYNDNTYLPALVFAALCFFSFDLLSFTHELLASTVLLFALNNLFKEIEFRIEKDEIILNLGIYLGVATLFIFSYIIFLFATILMLFIFTRPTARKLLLLLFGFVLPHGLLICFYFINGETTALLTNFYLPNLTVSGQGLVNAKSLLMLAALPLAYFVFSLFMLNREARFTKYQSQLFQVMFQWLLVCVVQVLVTRELTPHSMIIFIPSLAYFISHYLLLIRRKWISEVMFILFLAGLLSINLMARYGRIGSISYEHLFPTKSVYAPQIRNQRVMVLADDPGIYQENKLAGFVLDWKLSRDIFEQPDFYENVLRVGRAFMVDPPDRVIDPENLLGKFLQRIPELQDRYSRDGIYYVRRKDLKGMLKD